MGELSDRSDLYVLAQIEAAAANGDICAVKRLADELRHRLRKLRTEQMLYHIDGDNKPSTVRCDA